MIFRRGSSLLSCHSARARADANRKRSGVQLCGELAEIARDHIPRFFSCEIGGLAWPVFRWPCDETGAHAVRARRAKVVIVRGNHHRLLRLETEIRDRAEIDL